MPNPPHNNPFLSYSKTDCVPAVIGQLLAGVLLGGAGLNWVHPDILVHDFSEIGVILLMFLAGLESDISLLKRYFRPGMFVAILWILFPMLFGYLTGIGFQSSGTEAFFWYCSSSNFCQYLCRGTQITKCCEYQSGVDDSRRFSRRRYFSRFGTESQPVLFGRIWHTRHSFACHSICRTYLFCFDLLTC
ncbi:hypothetical protein CIRMBP1207_01177 [Enterococcus cecorum]|nr:hypothetical protein CIRMBP1212_00608 [Enterococcus cecorum]CAI3308900.1 hypothetical protein CIRMBP1281_00772 [Enterococcus cecorum]CAI3349047.1 hypothetical protein CIRMBP1207_01177 [Enterococcus cecorum]CAI3409546.1 hypothetical protein CIRMBP1313_00885 [Enterococcus cecorum]CAI3443916.1 hypothetical protein CIRMBP1290_01406 [Enterococcus cecorum]